MAELRSRPNLNEPQFTMGQDLLTSCISIQIAVIRPDRPEIVDRSCRPPFVSRNLAYVPSIILSFPLSATSLLLSPFTSRHDYFLLLLFLFFSSSSQLHSKRYRRAEAGQRGFDVNRRLQWFPLIGSISSSNGSVHEIESRICSRVNSG